MLRTKWMAVPLLLVLAGCSTAGAPTSPPIATAGPTESAVVAPESSGPPFSIKMKDGSLFTLAESIATKVRAKQPINYVFSYHASGIPLYSTAFQTGHKQGCDQAQSIYPLSCTLIAPVQSDLTQQISQIDALFNTGGIDCLAVEPTTANGLDPTIAKLLAAGIPVYTTGVPTQGNEFGNYTQIPDKEGRLTAQVVLDWMKAKGLNLTKFAMTGGDPTQDWAQGRMLGFMAGIRAAIPSASFVADNTNAITTDYDPTKAYDRVKAFITGNPSVEVIVNVDVSAEQVDKAIEDSGQVGKTYSIGWNPSYAQLDFITKGIQIASMDQNWPVMSGLGAKACATYMASGVLLPNDLALKAVTQDKVAEERAALDTFLGASPSP